MNNRLKVLSKAFTFTKNGSPEQVLRMRKIEVGELGNDKVLLKILAAPINPSDINIIEGTYPVSPVWTETHGAIPGQEGVAEVISVGSAVKSLSAGDWVLPLRQGFR
jgi:trans-2-enoyl-CoA reductase